MVFSTVLLYLTLAACGVVIAAVAIRYDLYEREPWALLAAAMAGGAVLMWAVGQGQVAVLRAAYLSDAPLSDTKFALMAGFSEETAKLGVVLLVALVTRRHFNDPLDGLVYGSFAGLGAALEESVAVLRNMPGQRFLPPQEPIRLAGHLVMGGISGFGAGVLVMRRRWVAAGAIALSLLAAALLHTLWDVVAFDAADYYAVNHRLKGWHTASPMALMLGGMILYRGLAGAGARMARAHFGVCDVRGKRRPRE